MLKRIVPLSLLLIVGLVSQVVRYDGDDRSFLSSEYACDQAKAVDQGVRPPFFERHFVSPLGHVPRVHAAAATELKDGRLLAVWYGGTREGATDVAIYSSHFDSTRGKWSSPVKVTDRFDTQRDLNRYIKKVGNPVLVTDSNGKIWLFYVTISVGGWSVSSISYRTSSDQGLTWSPAKRLVSSPFLNISTLVKGRPLLLNNNLIGLPVYHEFIGKFAEFLVITSDGQVIDKQRISHQVDAIQPWVIPTASVEAVTLLRTVNNEVRRVRHSKTNIFGAGWSELTATNLPNPNSAIAGARTSDCSYLLALNYSEEDRTNLSLAVSSDGQQWRHIATLENDPEGKEYSYPYLVKTTSGEYHLLYTYRRDQIAHYRFNESWLKQLRP